MNSIIDRAQLLDILQRWEVGLLTESQVQQLAESVTDQYDVPELPHHEDDSIAYEVLLYLDSLPAVLLTKEDIPALIAFLRTPSQCAEDGWQAWLEYWERVNDGERREQLRKNPFYFV